MCRTAITNHLAENRVAVPEDSTIQPSQREFDNWRSQSVTSNLSSREGVRHMPLAFTTALFEVTMCDLKASVSSAVSWIMKSSENRLQE